MCEVQSTKRYILIIAICWVWILSPFPISLIWSLAQGRLGSGSKLESSSYCEFPHYLWGFRRRIKSISRINERLHPFIPLDCWWTNLILLTRIINQQNWNCMDLDVMWIENQSLFVCFLPKLVFMTWFQWDVTSVRHVGLCHIDILRGDRKL